MVELEMEGEQKAAVLRQSVHVPQFASSAFQPSLLVAKEELPANCEGLVLEVQQQWLTLVSQYQGQIRQ